MMLKRALGLHGFLVLAVCLLTAFARADVLEFEGTVKAVDATARTITIERKTPKGTKTLELEVTKKAGDLTSVKAGDSISLSYDPNLEIVTKLGGGGGDADENQQKKGVRFSVSISETGEVKVGLSEPPPVKADSVQAGVTRTKNDDGTCVQTFRFEKPKALEAFSFAKNVSAGSGVLTLKPAKAADGDYLSAGCAPRERLRVPLHVDLDVESMQGEATLRLELNGGSVAYNGQHLFYLHNRDGLSSEAVVEAATGQGEKAEKRFKETVKLGEPWEKTFRLPIPNVENKDVYIFIVGAFGKCDVKIRQITITGQPVPTFGIGLDTQGDTVFAKMIAPNSLAKKAGIQEGDVIVSINGVAPKSMADALDQMISVGFEQACEIVVARGAEKKTISMTAKWAD